MLEAGLETFDYIVVGSGTGGPALRQKAPTRFEAYGRSKLKLHVSA
jgi:hypothetical protein